MVMMMEMQQHSHRLLVLLLMVFICGIALSGPSSPRRSRVRRQNMKVRINATGDTIVMKFLLPNADTKLEGYILGYGSSMFSKQFIQLPENGQPYETEIDAEPKYLIAVKPIPTNDVKKQCTGKVELQKPLHVVIGSVTPTSVLLSWGTLLKTPYEGNVMNDCLEDGHYTVRYRERNRKWNYQTCPTSDTVIDNLKPNTVYEFGVQPSSKDGTGEWSKPVIHNISSGGVEEKTIRKIFKRPPSPVKPLTPGPHSFPFPPRHGKGDFSRSVLLHFLEVTLAPKLRPPPHFTATMVSVPVPQTNVEKHGVHPLSQPQQKPQSQPHAKPKNPLLRPEYQPLPQPQTPKPQLKPKVKARPQPKPQPKQKLKLKPLSQPQPEPEPASQPILKNQPQSTSQPIHQNQPQPTSLSIPQAQPQPRPTFKPILQTHPLPQPQTRPTFKPILQTHHQSKAQPTLKPILQAQPRPQPRPTLKPILQTQPLPHNQARPTFKPILQTHHQSKARPTLKPILQVQPQPQPRPTLKPSLQTHPQPQSQALPTLKHILQTQPQAQARPTLKPRLQTHPRPQPQALPTLKPILQTQPQAQARPTMKPGLQTHPQPQPQALPTLKPILQTQPQAQARPTLKPRLQTKPQPKPQAPTTIKPILQTQPQPQARPTFKPILKSQPQPEISHDPKPQSTSLPIPHLQPRAQSISQPILQTQRPLQSRPKSHPKSQPQTTTQLQAEPQPHLKFQTQHQVQSTPKLTTVAYRQTTPPTFQQIALTKQARPKIHIQPQAQSTTQSQTQPQQKIPLEPQLTTKQQSMAQPTTKPKIPFIQTKPKTQPQSKSQSKPKKEPQPQSQPKEKTQPKTKSQSKPQPPSQPKKQPKPKTSYHQQPHIKIQQGSKQQPQTKPHTKPVIHFQPTTLPPKTETKSQLEHLPKPHPASRAQPQPRTVQFESQTRTYPEPTKVTPRQAVPTAPSPPEEGKPLPLPVLATEKSGRYDQGTGVIRSSVAEVPRSPISSSVTPAGRNTTLSRPRVPPHSTRNSVQPFPPSKTFTTSLSSSTPGVDGAHHRGIALPKPVVWSKEKPVLRPSIPVNKRPNLVGKPTDHDKPMDLKQGDKESILKPFALVTAKPKQERRQQTTTPASAVNSSRFDLNENSSIFRPLPTSEVDIMGKKRFTAPHVIYKTDKKPDEPCSITSSLAYFPDEEGSDQNVTGPPRIPPSNLTVVTVEGCPSFVILDWQKSDNETREYEVVSTEKGPNGEEVSILTTNQTHTAVENLKPESSYEFKVTPKNELGTGPSSDPVSFSTESADPRVSEYVSGKDAIWTQFPFKSDAYSECSGKQYVKRTWYRKFVGIQLCNSLRYKIYLSDSLNGKFFNIGDQTGHGEDHCQFVDSFLDGRTGSQMSADQLPSRLGFFRALRQEPVHFGEIGGKSHVTYVGWYECGTPIPGKW
ncbi:target of Nesh-SH3 isoform X3 [Sparus aurata]|uniref:target of Nesh-SH3 isoform X3 n=1 Tax=Sparus aurata TaxID=8175 RepID=UPI0011C11E6C|nr:target of Nesh-SH3-like isoform X3 [Sparus aurata]